MDVKEGLDIPAPLVPSVERQPVNLYRRVPPPGSGAKQRGSATRLRAPWPVVSFCAETPISGLPGGRGDGRRFGPLARPAVTDSRSGLGAKPKKHNVSSRAGKL